MERYYTINEAAMLTGLTTRTLRSYLKMDILTGEKVESVWKFTEEDLSSFLSNPNVKPSILAKKRSIVYDFLVDEEKRVNEICSIIDLYIGDNEAEEISNFFCERINNDNAGEKIRFSYERNGKHARFILSGYEEYVMELLNGYYNR